MFNRHQRELVALQDELPLDQLVAAAKLTRKEYEVMLRRHKQNLSCEQIAAEMRLPVQQVERLEKRAMSLLQQVSVTNVRVEPEFVPKRHSPVASAPAQSSREIALQQRRQKLIEARLMHLASTEDKVNQWFHVQVRAVGLHQLLSWCNAYLSDEQIVAISGLYADGLSHEQLRLLLKLDYRGEVEFLAREGIKTIWTKYPELAMQAIQFAPVGVS